ncbi:MAG TPA: tetratricopeptide repeat protein [Streptosporangiaceae bacterium]|nr:tetratricopeptide repeat protein [Streptosporangiaceae bacterium]
MEFRILGTLEAQAGGCPLPVSRRYDQSVLAALIVDAGRTVPLSRLIDTLWSDDPPQTAAKQVRNTVSRLRALLEAHGLAGAIVTERAGYRLAVSEQAVDAHRFKTIAAAANRTAVQGHRAEAAGMLRAALDLWRGPALAGLPGRVLQATATALNEQRHVATDTYYDLQLALGRHHEIAGELAAWAAGQPLRENATAQYMLALYRCGRRADALAAYHRARTLLATELGIDPGAELRRLHQQILTGDPELNLVVPEGRSSATAPGHRAGSAAGPAGPAALEVRSSLPPDAAAFTGRDTELAQVTAAVTDAAGAGGVVAVRAIDGMPGIGKTALAVHAAHVLADRFPDRQLFIDLHAHTPGRDPVRPQDALAGLLAATGVDPRFLPEDLDGRAAIWRDTIAGRRALLVLDNAASTSQVTPLLPGCGTCLVLVTSRRHLGDLPGVVTPVLLDVLPPAQAMEMFTRLAPRAAGSRDEVAEVVGLAGFLPLAVSLLARVFTRHHSWTLASLAAETRERLLTLTAESQSVTAAFAVSYRHLDPAGQRLFTLLGLHPGTTTDACAAAALTGTSLARATRVLDELHGEGLLTETGYRRYGMHDLLRRYARDQATAIPAQDAQQAVGRLLDYYQQTATRANVWLARPTSPGLPPATPPAGPPAAPDLKDTSQALAWARAERASLLACLNHATRSGQDARVITLTAAIAGLLRRDGPWADAITHHTTALRAGHRLGDRRGQAGALNDLGDMRRLMGDYPGAAQDLEHALGIYRDLSDRPGQANALNDLGAVRLRTGDYPGAAQDLEQALGICRELGDRRGQATAFNRLGAMRLQAGDYPGAAQNLEQALGIYRDLSDRRGQANSLHNLGDVRQRTGDNPAAAQDLEQALVIYCDLGDRRGQANTLHRLGAVRRATGDYPAAAQDLEQALSIYRDLRDPSGEAEALNERGTLHRASGEPARAHECHQQALELARAIASSRDEAHALAGLGRCAMATGNPAQAETVLRQALEIFQRTGAAETRDLLAELDALTSRTWHQMPNRRAPAGR